MFRRFGLSRVLGSECFGELPSPGRSGANVSQICPLQGARRRMFWRIALSRALGSECFADLPSPGCSQANVSENCPLQGARER
eukprot:3402411-Alexandrium_andersonii.AAC.1